MEKTEKGIVSTKVCSNLKLKAREKEKGGFVAWAECGRSRNVVRTRAAAVRAAVAAVAAVAAD